MYGVAACLTASNTHLMVGSVFFVSNFDRIPIRPFSRGLCQYTWKYWQAAYFFSSLIRYWLLVRLLSSPGVGQKRLILLCTLCSRVAMGKAARTILGSRGCCSMTESKKEEGQREGSTIRSLA